jgi:hypothetical protein
MSSLLYFQPNASASANAEAAGLAVSNPLFKYKSVPGDPQGVTIAPENLGLGASEVRIPFRSPTPIVITDLIGATIDTTTTGLSGVVDDVGAVISTDYHLWAFHDGSSFVGYGITRRPIATAIVISSGPGTFGSTTTFTVAAGYGYLFNTGARVLIRQGTNPGDLYNQGVITSRSDSTIEVLLDADYAVASESNTSLFGIAAGDIIQLDDFAPLSFADGLPYGGYYYSYLGSIFIDFALNIAAWRKRGELYWFDGLPAVYDVTANAAPAPSELCLARWLPFGIQLEATFQLLTGGIGQDKLLTISQNQGGQATLQTCQDIALSTGLIFNAQDAIPTLPTNQSVYVSPVKTGIVAMTRWAVYLLGYSEREF